MDAISYTVITAELSRGQLYISVVICICSNYAYNIIIVIISAIVPYLAGKLGPQLFFKNYRHGNQDFIYPCIIPNHIFLL